MFSTPIQSCNKYVLSYKDSSNHMHKKDFMRNTHNIPKSMQKNLIYTYMTIKILKLEFNKKFEVINYEFKKIVIRNTRRE